MPRIYAGLDPTSFRQDLPRRNRSVSRLHRIATGAITGLNMRGSPCHVRRGQTSGGGVRGRGAGARPGPGRMAPPPPGITC